MKKGFIWALALAFAGIAVPYAQAEHHVTTVASESQSPDWKKFHSVSGKCTIAFPETPEHIKQNMSMPAEEVDLNYDVYVAADGKDAVYMVLIAEYPDFVDEAYAELSLESFLNGIVSQHPSNQLVFADLVEVQGFKGLDFFVKTKGVFFKGRAIMAKNHLYLLAMECEQSNYKDGYFSHFISSFEMMP
ncbi:MAG: hypothetical protein WDZ28_00615 [Simkaniaceae bacterium]